MDDWSQSQVPATWSPEEAARYIETLKAYENKSPELIREKVESDYLSRLNGAVTSVRGVNKTDAATLGVNFGSLAAVMRASQAGADHVLTIVSRFIWGN